MADTAGNIILSNIIGKKPRIPQTYGMRKARGTDADIEFCNNVDERVAEWEKKADAIRSEERIKRTKEREDAEKFEVKTQKPIVVSAQDIYSDFLNNYKILNRGVSFNPKNPHSNSGEPLEYIYTLIYYFMKDKRFFDSPLLRKDISIPSFDKGTITIGGYGCGKSSTFFALLLSFKNHIKYVREIMPENIEDILGKYRINQCVSTDIENRISTVKHKSLINDIMIPLMSSVPLYIDDIMREDNASFNKNIFKSVLTHRADRKSKTHLTMNPSKNEEGESEGVEKSLIKLETRYDGRIHDRMFGYNVIEMTGKSFRR